MNWTDEGLLLSVNPHGEKSAIIHVLTKTKGIHTGIIQNAFSRKMSSTIQPSNQLYLNWSSRLEEHLGTYKVDLLKKINSKPEELSGGQKQRFSIACALVNEPKVLFLDEPTTGLDPQAKHNLWELIKELNLSGMTIILTTHNMEEAENLCHKVAIMDKGKIIIEGNPKDLINKYDREDGNLENVFLSLTGKELRD